MNRSPGFTVIESLITVAVLAIAAFLLLPSLTSSLQVTRQSQCVTNLRALWQAQHSYQNDHNGNFISYYQDGTYAWTARLMDEGYLPLPVSVFFCPAFSNGTDLKTPEEVAMRTGGVGGATRRGTYSHYGYNHYHLGASTRYPGGDPNAPARITQITHPARTIVFIDNIYTTSAIIPRGSYITVDNPNGTTHLPDPRHQGSLNIIFVDGHVENFKPRDLRRLFDPYPAGLGTTVLEGSLWKR